MVVAARRRRKAINEDTRTAMGGWGGDGEIERESRTAGLTFTERVFMGPSLRTSNVNCRGEVRRKIRDGLFRRPTAL